MLIDSVTQAGHHLGVDTVRVGNASTVASVQAFVDVGAALTVGAGVIEPDALNGGAREPWRAHFAPEARNQVGAKRARVTRIR